MTTYFAEDFEVLAEGSYPAVLIAVDESDKPGPYGDFLTWRFMVDGGDKGKVEVHQRSGTRFTKNTNARAWYEALVGRNLAKGEPIDLDGVIGTDCTVRLSIADKATGTWNNVEAVRRRPAEVAAKPEAAGESAPSSDNRAEATDRSDLPF